MLSGEVRLRRRKHTVRGQRVMRAGHGGLFVFETSGGLRLGKADAFNGSNDSLRSEYAE